MWERVDANSLQNAASRDAQRGRARVALARTAAQAPARLLRPVEFLSSETLAPEGMGRHSLSAQLWIAPHVPGAALVIASVQHAFAGVLACAGQHVSRPLALPVGRAT
jgi:hypothetical protein